MADEGWELVEDDSMVEIASLPESLSDASSLSASSGTRADSLMAALELDAAAWASQTAELQARRGWKYSRQCYLPGLLLPYIPFKCGIT
jgi:hypothetical protein